MDNQKELLFFAQLIEKELGIVYQEHNYFQLLNRLEQITTMMKVKDLPSLYELAQKNFDGEFKRKLLDISTNNETSFFRDAKVFHALEKLILEAVEKKTINDNKLRLWSAASSTGQEALSIAILVEELNQKKKIDLKLEILASDICSVALTKAKEARYSDLEVQRGLSDDLLKKYFEKKEDGKWYASSRLTQNITYKELNLKHSFPITDPFNFIFCRNVLIYQSIEGKTDILRRLSNCLVPCGYLVLGSGESLLGLSKDYEQIMVDGAVIYQKKI